MPNYYNIQMHMPWGREDETRTDPKEMLHNFPPVIGTGEWDNYQCEDFKNAPQGSIVLVREGSQIIALVEITSENFTDDGLEEKFHHHNYRKIKVLGWADEDSQSNWQPAFSQGTFKKNINPESVQYQFIDKWYHKIMENQKEKKCQKFLEKNYNMILTGAPGTGKTYLARQIAAKMLGYGDDISKLNNNSQFGFTQFHPSYDYVDFVEGLRPNDEPNGREFVYKKGIFKSFCEIAAKDENPEHKYVFVIDEINRGDISKIFGELFFSVDPGYRKKENRILVKTQYQSMIPKEDVFYGGFYVPENVYIIGTMNDIDRSVESLDFAFRRRFPTIEVKVEDTLESITAQIDDKYRDNAKEELMALNKVIKEDENLGSSYCIGGSYLLKLNELEGDENIYQSLWDYYIKNLLLEYLRGFEQEDIKNKMNNFAGAFGVSANLD